MKKIAYLGPAGTWSEAAAASLDGNDSQLLPLASIPAVVAAVETGLADEGVVPVENSLEGAVSITLDLLIHETSLHTAGEIILPIRHMLLAHPGATLADIETLRSHPQALAQCRRFIEHVLPHVTTTAALSTAAAVEEMLRDPRSAAVGTPRAAEIYSVQVLARDIQDKQINETRFLVLAPNDAAPTGDDKTSLCFAIKQDRPGSLVDILGEFVEKDINLTKVESRPARERLGRYIFLCDIQGHRSDPHIVEALSRVVAKAEWMKIFGSYPAWRGG